MRVKTAEASGHVRTPTYIRGKTGVVRALHGTFRNPEQLAYGQEGMPKVPLYFVTFQAQDVWGGSRRSDKVVVDLYEHWLEPA